MRLPAALLLLPLLAAAQAPPEVDQALRERAALFLQYQVDGNFRKSFELVAEESKDWYFASSKAKILSYKIDAIEYTEDFTKAMVKSAVKRTVTTLGQSFLIDLPMLDRWKIEDGKWVWYHDPTMIDTTFGSIPVPSSGAETPSGAAPAGVPADMSPAAVTEAATKLRGATSVDKKAITFKDGTAGVEEIVFHNGVPGVVRLVVSKTAAMDSISVDVTETKVGPEQDVRVKVSYTPDESRVKRTILRLAVEPFGRVYAIPVTLTTTVRKE